MKGGGVEWGGIGEVLDASLRRRVDILSEKNEAKNSARDCLDVEDGSEVVCLRCGKEFKFSRGDVCWGLTE